MTSVLNRVRTSVLEIAYEQSGSEDGVPVLLMHGFPYDPRTYDLVVPLLVAAGCRAIVPYLRGYGPTRFLAAETPRSGQQAALGHDLKELTSRRSDPDGGRAYFRYMMSLCSKTMLQIVNLPRPVIAAVQGVATAAGCQLVASCDLAVASTAAKFATPGVDIGLFCSTPMVALSRNIARKHAMEMLLTGDAITAEHAYRMGLINRVVSPGKEREEALAFARKIAGKSSHIVKIGKEGFYRQAEMSLGDAYQYVSEVMVENLMARDAEEGLNAFIEKREPKWEDR